MVAVMSSDREIELGRACRIVRQSISGHEAVKNTVDETAKVLHPSPCFVILHGNNGVLRLKAQRGARQMQ